MLQALAGQGQVELSVAWPNRDCSTRLSFNAEGIRYYVFPDPSFFPHSRGILRKIGDQLEYFSGPLRNPRSLAEGIAVVRDFRPDLVHVFGSENWLGLMAPSIEPPLAIWIQGILDVYRHSFFGSMHNLERLKNPRILWTYFRMLISAEREREIFRRCMYFMGRTHWDRIHQKRLQPEGRYYNVQECLRPEFYDSASWDLRETKGQSIYTTTSASLLLKGTDDLIRAIGILRLRYPEIRLRVAGVIGKDNPIVRRLFRLVQELNLAGCIDFLGQLNSPQIVGELRRARVFVLPSYIENSPNSLAEAQLVGTPVVASSVGGVPDMVEDGETGILYPAGDVHALAFQIDRLLKGDALAERLSQNSRRAAHRKHSPESIVKDLLHAYAQIVAL
jgi:L-malate glycosyltransferase